MNRAFAVVAGVCLALGFSLVASPASAAPGDEHLAGLEYVALGDSYAAGFGLTPLTGVPHVDCAQSAINYPHQVAAELGLALHDVSCSGAVAMNLTTTPQTVTGGTVPVQAVALSATTDIVTVTIGGNDLGYVDILTACASLSEVSPVIGGQPTCSELYNQGPTDLLVGAITGPIRAGLEATIQALAFAAPNAAIFVVGYPALAPSELPVDGCFRDAAGTFAPPFPVNAYPYKDVDVAYLHSIEVLLDGAIGDAAAAAGATYLSALDATDGHSPCATVDAYVNGITILDLSLATTPPTVVLGPGAMHPNAAGAAFFATQVEAAIRAAFPAPVVTQPAGEILPATGSDSSGWLTVTGIALLLLGGFAMRFRRAVQFRG
jgi:LPXTG-motif cell wall-anchored protein